MQIISTMVLYNYKVLVIIKKIHILSWSIMGKPSKYFPELSRTYEQNSRTFQNRKKNPGHSRTFPGCGNPVFAHEIMLRKSRETSARFPTWFI